MRRKGLIVFRAGLLLALAAFASGPSILTAQTRGPAVVDSRAVGLQPDTTAVQELLRLTNSVRLRHGLSTLRLVERLNQCAHWMAADMAVHGYFGHKDRLGRLVDGRADAFGYRWRAIAENLAGGQESPQEAIQDWMDSPGHRRNMLDPNFTEIGLARVKFPGSKYREYWVQVFGVRRAD